MCLINGAFIGGNNFDVIKMHDTRIRKKNIPDSLSRLDLRENGLTSKVLSTDSLSYRLRSVIV
jgi:hypothetical protein